MSEDEAPKREAPDPDVAAEKAEASRPARPSPASRARRIGGGVAPSSGAATRTSSAAAGARPAAAPRSGTATKPVSTTKTAVKPAPAGARAEPGAAQAGPTVKGPRKPAPAWLHWVPAALFTALAVAFLVLIVVDKAGNDTSSSTNSKQRQTVLAGAKNCVAATNTYKYTNVDSYEKAGLKCSTGIYAKQYRNAMETLIKKNAPSQKFTQRAQVNTAGVEAVTGDGKQWSVLIYGQLNITNTATGKEGRIDPFALVATMEQVKGKWLIAKVRLLSTVDS